jgi:hypothetical protein
MVPDQLGCCNAPNDAFGKVAAMVRAGITTPRVLLFANEDYIVIAVCVTVVVAFTTILALVHVALIPPAAPVDLLHFALIVVVLFLAGFSTGHLPVLCDFRTLVNDLILRLLPDNNLLAHRFLHDNGLWCLLADDDGLRGRRFRSEELGGPRVLFELVGRRFSHRQLPLVLPLEAVLSYGRWRRWRALYFTLDAVLADLAVGAGRRRRALDVAFDVADLADLAGGGFVSFHNVLSSFAPDGLVPLDYILSRFTALLDRLALAVDKAHFGLVGVFLEAVVGNLVALDGGVAARSTARGRLPVALPLALSEDGRHGVGSGGTGKMFAMAGPVSRARAGGRLSAGLPSRAGGQMVCNVQLANRWYVR